MPADGFLERWSARFHELMQAVQGGPVRPERCIFVAAHQWDLDAAAEHGFRTAHLDGTGGGHRARADDQAPDLAALAAQLD